MNWSLDLSEGIDLAIYLFGAFEVQTTRFLKDAVRPGDIVLDIGANIGAHTLPLARSSGPEGRVYAFEATSFAFRKLLRNIELNPGLALRVNPIQCLLSDRLDSVPKTEIVSSWSLETPPKARDALAGVAKSVDGAQVLTIDLWAESNGIAKVDLIKIDVDGHEPEVLAGAENTLRKFHPKIVMEVAPYCYSDEPERLNRLMRSLQALGYKFRNLDSNSRPMTFEFLLQTIPRAGSINVLAEMG